MSDWYCDELLSGRVEVSRAVVAALRGRWRYAPGYVALG